MKLVCTQSELNTNLSLVSRAIPSRPTHPVLGNVLLAADSELQRVQLTAFDLSLGIQTSFNAVVETGGKIAIPAKLLNDIVSRLPEGEITLTMTALVKSSRSSFSAPAFMTSISSSSAIASTKLANNPFGTSCSS
ncbi:MAG: DNA polymerase III subunit beta, partial [Symploca sp. SIO3E6]|nr:DNA polymerase III subunit beta [Caldora sp. SIO3E6]